MNLKSRSVTLCLCFAIIFASESDVAGAQTPREINESYAILGRNSSDSSEGEEDSSGRKISQKSEFPEGLLSLSQLRNGGVVLYFAAAFYSFVVIGIVCGDYFLPSVDCICCQLNLSQDVAAATFMSFATTAPELFVILVATFLTKSDVGVGAVVGSGMFNVLGVATIGGLAARSPIKLDWWPLYRDSLVYVFAPLMLALVLADGEVTPAEAVCLIAYYFFYFIIMCFNRKIRNRIKAFVKEFRSANAKKIGEPPTQSPSVPNISLTLDDGKSGDHLQTAAFGNLQRAPKEGEDEDYDGSFKSFFMNYEDSISLRRISASSAGSRRSNRSNRSRKKSDRSVDGKFNVQATSNHLQVAKSALNDNFHFVCPRPPEVSEEMKKSAKGGTEVCKEEEEEEAAEEITLAHFFTLPEGSLWNRITWVVLWPATFALHFTVPDCRSERWRRFYPVTFLMCVFWIGISSYFGTWMVSVVGETIGIPESVMGLTVLALGGSMPEAISTFIMSRQGEGGLGFSNSLGGNTMDICLCLGLPWLIKCAIDGSVKIESEGLQYNTISLVVGIVILLTVVTKTRFYMNKKMGTVCCVFYLMFVVLSVLIELNIIELNVER